MKVQPEFTLCGVVFDDGLVKGQPISELLLKLIEFAESVVKNLAATLP